MSAGSRAYIVVTSPENWATTAGRGWTLLGLKSTKPGQASALKPGDHVIAYATGRKQFIAALDVMSEMVEDHTPIWGSAKKPGEDYPYRVQTRPVVTLAAGEGIDAFALARRLEYAQKWGAHISLAFQGNIRPIPSADYEVILAELRQAQAMVAGV